MKQWNAPPTEGRIERIAVREGADWPWRWFDGPVTVTPRHQAIAHEVLEEQAMRATTRYPLAQCWRVRLTVDTGEDITAAEIDWALVLVVANERSRTP